MNHCRDCNSDYSAPGTCNCFAPCGKRACAPSPVTVAPIPAIPYVPYVPPYGGGGTAPSPTWAPYIPGLITVTWSGSMTDNRITVE